MLVFHVPEKSGTLLMKVITVPFAIFNHYMSNWSVLVFCYILT